MTKRTEKLADAQMNELIDNMLYCQGMQDYEAGVFNHFEDMAYLQGVAKAEDEARFPTKPTPDEELTA